ncbi:MAG: hypothetical protein A2Y62_15580 [Candidatus Fischerbacteria bacterium RBG_13_37_8]|uniref:Uncharacterized protein n=1 Tax=Candidatus Fischerbacteria bacterium RBG_13_37_8 TaxID=1817863 RepID=A0A1F5VKZ9_9BACT|nr:MAG: hypothetical protein A2Y62_15580 [Candidatus Fischerbacteria bacterium RBG_13_37_8]
MGIRDWGLGTGTGDWGMGIRDWGLGALRARSLKFKVGGSFSLLIVFDSGLFEKRDLGEISTSSFAIP